MKNLRNRIIPVLLMNNQGLYKGRRFKNHVYVGDPINAIKIFNDKEVDELIVLDIAATARGSAPDFEYLESLAGEAFMPMAYGGGVSQLWHVDRILSLGFEKIVINTAAYSNTDLIRNIVGSYGSQSLVLSIDVRLNLFGRHSLFSRSGTKEERRELLEYVVEMTRLGVGEIMINSIDRDGTLTGYDLELIKKVNKSVSIPVIACGGAKSADDFLEAKKAGADAMAAGAMFVFKGPLRGVLISYPEYAELVELLGDEI